MIPQSVYKKPLEKIPKRSYCLVVDDDNDLLQDYTTLCNEIYPNSGIRHSSQENALKYLQEREYDCIIVDNDSFRVGEYRGLETVKRLVGLVDPSKIVYTSALPDKKMQEESKTHGLHFIEKGKWKKLEQIMKELFLKEPI